MKQRLWTSAALAVVTVVFGVAESTERIGFDGYRTSFGEALVVGVLATAAAAAALVRPGAGLGLLWLLLAYHVSGRVSVGVTDLIATAVVAFGCGRWGSRATLVASVASMPLAGLALALFTPQWQVADFASRWGLQNIGMRAYQASPSEGVALAFAAAFAVAVPWLVGLSIRLVRRSAASEASQREAEIERDEAAEIAHLREAQAQLARDVHDVVGHSLTVILAQAEAAQYHPDPERVRTMMATIADTARGSLEDVRRVLDATAGRTVAPASVDVESLLDPIRASGREVAFTEVGMVRPLPPDRAAVAHRVLQEMLTNAVRHGDASAPVRVERRWSAELVLQVSNGLVGPRPDPETSAAPEVSGGGHGLPGMRRRVESVGGRLEILVGLSSFTALATIPLAGRFSPPDTDITGPTGTARLRTEEPR